MKGDFENFEIYLQEILLSSSSYYDIAGTGISRLETGMEKEKYKNFYHGLILGIMVNISEEYYVESNREYGLGRPDIVIIPKDKDSDKENKEDSTEPKKGYILEFKNEYTSSGKTAEDAVKEALKQIEDRKYEEGVKNTGVKEVVKVGLGFKGKELKMAFKLPLISPSFQAEYWHKDKY